MPTQLNDTHHAYPFAMQSHDLLAPLVQPFQCLKSCVLFVHAKLTEMHDKSSIFIVPNQ
jgi:hypothetical protein